MKTILTALGTFLLVVTGCKGTSGGSNTTSCSTAELESEMTSLLNSAISEVDFSYSIQRNDGRTYTYNRGASTLSTSYESASTSKLVTAVIILRLVEQGELALSDRPQDYITGWPITNGDPLYSMTLADLLSFRSGLVDEHLCLNSGIANFTTCAKNVASANTGGSINPGDSFYYSGAHLQVAGLMAMVASGKSSWQEVFTQFKTETGLFATSAYDLPSSTNPRLAGGMHWTAEEYLAFLNALKNGSLLNSASMTKLLADQTASATISYSPTIESLNEDWHYGFGLWHECQSPTFNCTAGVRVSSPGAYGAYPFWDRNLSYIGIVARQGSLGTYPKGIALERVARSTAEAWAVCRE